MVDAVKLDENAGPMVWGGTLYGCNRCWLVYMEKTTADKCCQDKKMITYTDEHGIPRKGY